MFRPSMADSIGAFILMAVCLAFAAQTTSAQSTQSSGISGSVMDTSGGAVSGAIVTAVDQKTAIEKSTVADAAGQFVFDSLPAGIYTIRAAFPGFTSYEKKDVVSPATLQISIALYKKRTTP